MAQSFVGLSFIGALVCGIFDVSATECGTTDFTRRLISKGTATERGEFPFLAAVYLLKQMEFICGGSLISAKHVLTAAHCTNGYGIISRPADVIVFLGAYDLTSRNETSVVRRDVIDIHCHPDWYAYSEKYDADVAILVLREIVSFTHYIRPVCMPPDDSVVAGVNGTIVGWGLTENGTQSHLQYPKQGVTNALNDSYCYTTDYIIAKISSLRTFCGSGGYNSPNRGDSGGGFFVRYGAAWVQFGIVSAMRSNATGFVDSNSISVYSIVKEFKTWINDTVRLSGGEVGEVSEGMKNILILNCHYEKNYNNPYSCRVDDVDIRMENFEVIFSGYHQDGKTDEDVEKLEFHNGRMFYLPDGIGKNFQNLKVLGIGGTFAQSLNMKLIRRSSFKNLKSLEILDLWKNDIVSIEEDPLWDLPHLKYFSLDSNKIESIPGNLFANNLDLEYILISKNRINTIDEMTFSNNLNLKKIFFFSNELESIPANLFKNNLKLEQINFQNNRLKTIDEVTFSNNLNLKKINLGFNRIESIPANLFKNNLKLTIIWIENNRLKTIGVDFSVLQNLESIDLRNNLCIDKSYKRYGIYKDRGEDPKFNNFLETIRDNCSSATP